MNHDGTALEISKESERKGIIFTYILGSLPIDIVTEYGATGRTSDHDFEQFLRIRMNKVGENKEIIHPYHNVSVKNFKRHRKYKLINHEECRHKTQNEIHMSTQDRTSYT